MGTFDYVFERTYKNAEIEIVVEDNAITMGRIYIDGKCVDVREFTTDKGEDVPFNSKNYDTILDQLKAEVDVYWEDNFVKITR